MPTETPPAQIVRIVEELKHAYPRQAVTQRTLDLYVRELVDLPIAAVAAAARRLIRTSRYFPEVSELRAAAAEILLGLPDEPTALAQVDARQRWARLDPATRPDPPHLHAAVRSAVDAAGGWHAFRVGRPEKTFSQFLHFYAEIRANAIRDVQVDGVASLAAGVLTP